MVYVQLEHFLVIFSNAMNRNGRWANTTTFLTWHNGIVVHEKIYREFFKSLVTMDAASSTSSFY
jgi:hypothetical protein